MTTATAKKRKTTKYTTLTKVEKLDGQFPGLATSARALFDCGVSSAKAAEILRKKFPTEEPSTSNLYYFRKTRWAPQKELSSKKFAELQAFFDENGGNYGLDLAAFAKVRELMDESKDIKVANDVRLLILKIRAQELKEEEFDFKTLSSQPGQPAEGSESDPAAEETKRKRVMNKIRGIFGLSPLPVDADDEETEVPDQESDEDREEGCTETGLKAAPTAGSTTGPSQNCAPGATPPDGAQVS